MMVTINGEQKQFFDNQTLLQVLHELNLNPVTIAVELNRTIIPRNRYESTVLKERDKLEIISFVGGG